MNRIATLVFFENNCSVDVVNIFTSVHAVSKADTRCIISEQCISDMVFVPVEKQLVMFWHRFETYIFRKQKNGFRKL